MIVSNAINIMLVYFTITKSDHCRYEQLGRWVMLGDVNR